MIVMVTKFLIYLLDNIYFKQSSLFSSIQRVYCTCLLSSINFQSERKAWFYLALDIVFFTSINRFFIGKKSCFLKVTAAVFQNNFQFSQYLLKKPVKDSIFSKVSDLCSLQFY